MLGTLGHLSVIIAFVSVLACVTAYCLSYFSASGQVQDQWLKFARTSFSVHAMAVLSVVGILYAILYFRQYQYEYAWQHVSNDLPFHFIISSFWEGQEGSFLLWINWNAAIGFILIKAAKSWEKSTMAVFCAIQLWLISMVLGVHFTSSIKIGSSPFMLLKDTLESDIFSINPSFVPQDGTGLNPLLQNIWMVIHPPVIFLGFALSGVPFSLALAALWQNQPKEFVRKAAPWVLATVVVLGAGIMMGAYWAYETLNFGGYWNWDPVENAVLVPWLVCLATIHGMVLYRRKQKGLGITLFLAIAGFILIVYSTFLTRSGILGNASVHSFTDLGLSGQLLCFLLVFVVLAAFLLFYRRKSLKEVGEEPAFLSLEFWMFLAIGLFGLSAFQIIIPTSIPVFNTLLQAVGINENFAPPTDQIGFYSQFQLWFAVAFCLAAGFGQVFYWKKIRSGKSLENEVVVPVIATLIITSLLVFLGKTANFGYICLIGASIYLMVICLQLLISMTRRLQKRTIGGLMAHAGMALMLLGFVYSAGHQKVLSRNLTLNAPESDLPVHTIRKNLLLNRNVPRKNGGYTVTYKGSFFQESGSGELLDTDQLLPTVDKALKVMGERDGASMRSRYQEGDTLKIDVENRFYALELKDEAGNQTMIRPRMQNNPTMGYIASPAISSYLTKDIYTHITNFPDPEKVKWTDKTDFFVSCNDTIHYNGLHLVLEGVALRENPPGIPFSEKDLPLEARVRILDQYGSYLARPLYHIDQYQRVRLFPDEIEALGAKVYLSNLDPLHQTYQLSLTHSTRDWVTMEAIELPFVGLVWLGSLILIGGVCISLSLRVREAREIKQKEGLKSGDSYQGKEALPGLFISAPPRVHLINKA